VLPSIEPSSDYNRTAASIAIVLAITAFTIVCTSQIHMLEM